MYLDKENCFCLSENSNLFIVLYILYRIWIHGWVQKSLEATQIRDVLEFARHIDLSIF
jgi:hypothetical protein